MGMKAKTIKTVIRKKVDDWLASIEDEGVRALAEKNVVVTGGCIASMLLGEEVNDFDLYFRNRETTKAVAEYYVSRFKPKLRGGIACAINVQDSDERIKIVIKSAGIASEEGTGKPYEYFEARPEGEGGAYVSEILQDPEEIADKKEEIEEAVAKADEGKPKYRPVFLSTNAITLSHKVQIVLRFFGEPDEIHANYDFVHCTNYWTSKENGTLTLRPDALEALLAKELRYVGSRYPICSLIRTRKFIKRGWHINAGQMLKMAWQVSELDLHKYEVIEDQLTGVDVAYFMEVVSKLKEKDPEKVNAAYLVEIIDRMF